MCYHLDLVRLKEYIKVLLRRIKLMLTPFLLFLELTPFGYLIKPTRIIRRWRRG
jgi:hypothetical protein